MNTNFIGKSILGVLARALFLAPLIVGFFYTGEFTEYLNNLSLFILIILGIASALYLIVMLLVPPEYAIKTDIKVLEFNMWTPQIVMICVMGTVALGVAVAFAMNAAYWSAGVLFFYALAQYLWPRYVKRIDVASKEHMINTLKG